MHENQEKNSKLFGYIIIFGLILLLGGVIVKLVELQIVKHAEYEAAALSQQTVDTVIEAVRGSIYDRGGNELAVSATAYQITASPNRFPDGMSDYDFREFAHNVAVALGIDEDKVYAQASNTSSAYTIIARQVEKDAVERLRQYMSSEDYIKNKYTGVLHIGETQKRYYPHGTLLSTVLGFVGTDNQGLEGLEMKYDSYLSGTDGKKIAAQGLDGTALPFEYEKVIDAEDGSNLYLTIDIRLQYILEKYISETRVDHNVQQRVAGIIMDVKTGEILAMASKPDYDPNDPFTIADDMTLSSLASEYTFGTEEYINAYNTKAKEFWRNKLCEQYEPGSTFKILTAAMALEEGKVTLYESFNCYGWLEISGVRIHCNKRDGHGDEDLREGLANSCNPVFMKLALRIGASKFYDYITLFGLRDRVNCGVQGEQAGYHYSLSSFNDVELAESGFGQGFKITPLQLISAVCSVINDGNYMQPYIIKQITDTNGNIIESNSPRIVKQTVSKETSDILCEYLEYTVEKNKQAYIKGYHIGGKTGTSQKLDVSEEKTVASFIGFAPASDPQVCVLVVVDEPNSTVQYGSVIAAPLAKRILKDTLDYLGIEPEYEEGDIYTVSVPSITGLTVAEAKDALEDAGFYANIFGDSSDEAVVSTQLPKSRTKLPEGSMVVVFTDDIQTSKTVVVPDLTGYTTAECNRLLKSLGLNIDVVGDTINLPTVKATGQSPAAGETVNLATVVTVYVEKEQD